MRLPRAGRTPEIAEVGMRYRKEPIRASEEEKTVVVPLREEEDGVVSRSFGFACRGTLACGEYGAERLAGFETLPQGETVAACPVPTR